MKIIGICGSSGSGKSTVCKILSQKGICVLDCDQIYHQLVGAPSECLTAIGEHFGSDLILNGSLDRGALRNVVFSDPKKLDELNTVSHHYVKIELKKRIEELKNKGDVVCVIDAPMFFEAKLDLWCDVICVVVSDFETQINRICSRDYLTRQDAILRLSKQFSSEELIKKADFVIKNDGNLNDLETQCDSLIDAVTIKNK